MVRKYVRYSISIIIALGLILSIINIHDIHTSPQPTIKIEPKNNERISVGETFNINVTVEGCENIYAVQVDIRYDPYILRAIKVIEGPFLKSFGETLVLFNESRINEEATPPYGQVYFVASLTGEATGASGSGVLLTVTFQVLKDGSSLISFFEYPGGGVSDGTYFMDADYREIIPIFENGFYGTPIAIKVSPTKITIGENLTISGQVLGVEKTIDVTLYYKKEGGNWIELTTISTNASGYFAYSWKPPGTGKYYFKALIIKEGKSMESSEVSAVVESISNLTQIGIIIGVVVVIIIALVILLRKRRIKTETSIPE